MNFDEDLHQEVAEELHRLIDVSRQLREAMLTRDPTAIQTVVEQNDQMRPSPALIAAPAEVLEDEEIGRLTQQLRRLQESNRLLATTFLKLYRNIFQPRQEGTYGETGLYGRSVRRDLMPAGPMLIHQTG